MCDKSRNTWLCVHWQWNTLEWCQLNALQASPVVHLVTPLSCVSLSMNTQPSVPAIETFTLQMITELRYRIVMSWKATPASVIFEKRTCHRLCFSTIYPRVNKHYTRGRQTVSITAVFETTLDIMIYANLIRKSHKAKLVWPLSPSILSLPASRPMH